MAHSLPFFLVRVDSRDMVRSNPFAPSEVFFSDSGSGIISFWIGFFRRVSGRQNVINNNTVTPYIARNHWVALHPHLPVNAPPITGARRGPHLNTMESLATVKYLHHMECLQRSQIKPTHSSSSLLHLPYIRNSAGTNRLHTTRRGTGKHPKCDEHADIGSDSWADTKYRKKTERDDVDCPPATSFRKLGPPKWAYSHCEHIKSDRQIC